MVNSTGEVDELVPEVREDAADAGRPEKAAASDPVRDGFGSSTCPGRGSSSRSDSHSWQVLRMEDYGQADVRTISVVLPCAGEGEYQACGNLDRESHTLYQPSESKKKWIRDVVHRKPQNVFFFPPNDKAF